jgi:hypothetical protein
MSASAPLVGAKRTSISAVGYTPATVRAGMAVRAAVAAGSGVVASRPTTTVTRRAPRVRPGSMPGCCPITGCARLRMLQSCLWPMRVRIVGERAAALSCDTVRLI